VQSLSGSVGTAPRLHCDDADSVLSAIEETWRKHSARTGEIETLNAHLAELLNANGIIIDACDGLEVLEHCRRHNLPIIDVLHALEERARAAGYDGGPLNLADYQISGHQVYVFYDSKRFENFAEVKTRAAERAPFYFAAQARG
jgi:hypothetical protein